MSERNITLSTLLFSVGVGALTGFGAIVILGLITSNPTLEPTEGVENQTNIFQGYEAYLDYRISASTVSGTSMEPTFGSGDKILWIEVEPTELKVGDIIIYEHPTKPGKGLIAHRIIEVIKSGGYKFETKGDNRAESDAETAISAYLVSEGDIKGLVIGVIYHEN